MAGWNMDGVGLLPQNMHHQIELEWRIREKNNAIAQTKHTNKRTNEKKNSSSNRFQKWNDVSEQFN